MKYTDEQIDAFLVAQGIKLLPSQRELFKKCVNHQKEDGMLYINMARWNGRSYFKRLVKKMRGELKMKIKFSLSGFTRRSGNPFDIFSEEFKQSLVGKPVYLERYKHIGWITDVDPEADLIYAKIPDEQYKDLILDSKGYNMCSFEIVKEE